MLIDGYVAEQMKKAMLNSEQEQVKVYDAYYNKGVTDGYNQALEDFEREIAYFCFGLKASGGNLCRVDVVEDELQRVKRQLIK